ncbi:Hypothetical Protein SLY_0762 [Strawberry lethal yellows phytoplasma (CPA) str. NZSb11]|uniref:Uncharacterized protein n=1 Tax=Strawberry lethal yellows phytoplasma (CPA) str. NZSb11 TaxID=980422 RepID=R4RXP6_PHYAS|nr:Hypothetical Protein SLY_0762 [Strawberry lethal yellows phytoplasma (CPA) str. NZSb11]
MGDFYDELFFQMEVVWLGCFSGVVGNLTTVFSLGSVCFEFIAFFALFLFLIQFFI